MSLVQRAPGASVAVPEFHEINRTVKFSAPAKWLNFPDTRIDLDERARPDQRVQHRVPQTYVAIEAVAEIQMLDERDRNFAPDLDDTRDQVGIVHIKASVKSHGNETVRSSS